jgi:hypothetical protein
MPWSSRIFVLMIKTKFNNPSFINVHAPTEERMKEKRKPFDRKWKKHMAYVHLMILKYYWGM